MRAILPVLFLVSTPALRAQDEALANYLLDGKQATVTRTDVALEMAFHLRRRDRGQQACEQLVATALTRRAAEQKKLMPTEAEVRAFWNQLQDQLRAAGRRPEEFAAIRNTSEAQWFADLAVQMAQERVVRAELGLGKNDAVGGDMLQLWLQEERKKATVVVDADTLPAGTAVRVGDTDVPLIDLGMLLLRTAEDEELDKFVQQVAYLNSLERLAAREGVTITSEDLDASIQKRAAEAQKDPRYRGATFENLLKAEGLSLAALRDLRTFRAGILVQKLADKRCTTAQLAAEIAADRAEVLAKHGPRRRIGLIFTRATETPNGLITKTFDEARQHLEGVRARLAKEKFDTVARIESDHNSTKLQGGDAGWHRQKSEKLPKAIVAAAFALPVGEVSMPLRTDDGYCLVKTIDVEPDPDDATLMARLREAKGIELGKQLLDEAKVERIGKPVGPGTTK
ncbi:MAG: peptidyl-prolyl cis-trans isomerase [Planctomycetes bacterium]|nr:peptidyl-prolyl cis-trans isomerase [Planctomycetota bacterium]